MPIKMIRDNIAKVTADAIACPTDAQFSHGGGIDAVIHAAAGEELYDACLAAGELRVGEAVVTSAYRLPSKYVIHTVGPVWQGGSAGEEYLLRSCYASVLRLAVENKCKSLAIPLISSGAFGFPKDKVLKIAIDEISRFLFDNELLVYIVVFDKTSYSISRKLFADVTSYIDGAQDIFAQRQASRPFVCMSECAPIGRRSSAPSGRKMLDEMLRDMDKGFAETLFDYIDKKGLSDVECYKRANVDKKTFSKIKCNKNYRPSKITAVSFAIALRLDKRETEHLLNTVGMSLSRSSKFDLIIEYFITTGNYKDIFEVNEVLYQFDVATLGV